MPDPGLSALMCATENAAGSRSAASDSAEVRIVPVASASSSSTDGSTGRWVQITAGLPDATRNG